MDLLRAVLEVIPEFAKKGSQMGIMTTLERLFHIQRIVMNKEDMALEDIVEAF